MKLIRIEVEMARGELVKCDNCGKDVQELTMGKNAKWYCNPCKKIAKESGRF